MIDPFTTMMRLGSGVLDPERKVTERRLSDMRGMYLEPVPEQDLERLVYRVSEIPAPRTGSDLMSSTTVIEPGTVAGEYHMTKGHFHANRDRAEIYVTLAGEGRLVMALDDGRHDVQPMRAGSVNYVPGWWAHRSVNVGDEPLVFFAAYPADAGYDYGTIEERGFPVIVREADGRPEVVPNPRYGG